MGLKKHTLHYFSAECFRFRECTLKEDTLQLSGHANQTSEEKRAPRSRNDASHRHPPTCANMVAKTKDRKHVSRSSGPANPHASMFFTCAQHRGIHEELQMAGSKREGGDGAARLELGDAGLTHSSVGVLSKVPIATSCASAEKETCPTPRYCPYFLFASFLGASLEAQSS